VKIIICGAGIAGLAAARGLVDHDVEIVIIERSPQPRRQGYMIDFFGPGYDAAAELGVLDDLRRRAHAIDRVSWHNRSGHRTATMRYAAIARAADGQLISLMRPDVEEALRESVDGRVEFRWGAAVTEVQNAADGVRVVLSDGSRVDGDLLIGADGIHSTVRRLTFGPEERFLRPLGFHTAAWMFDDPAVRDLVGDRWVMTDTLNAEVGLYGLDGDRVAAFGVHRTDDVGLPADPARSIREAYRGLGWIVPRVVEQCPPAAEIYYDIVAQVEVPDWVDRRVVLLGDSCQAVSLIAGQGASLAVAGGFLLSRLLTGGADIDTALAAYQERWRPVVEVKQQAGRDGVRWFLPGSRRTQLLRRLIMNASALPGVSRLMVDGLIGKAGNTIPDTEVPRAADLAELSVTERPQGRRG
jgi:2-polyprenyl-6-methoxyphenol hydroxylase-like FAD-dependent oxidoreductase